MPLDATIVGREIGTRRLAVDARWLMAYAAGVPDERPELYDTLGTLVTHPLFPVAPEWDLVIGFRLEGTGLLADEARRGVHTAHDVLVERSLRPGEEITVTGRVLGVGRRGAGAEQHLLFEAVDEDGATVWRTRLTSLYRGVELAGEPAVLDVGWPERPPPAARPGRPLATATSPVRRVDAHVYTECARIWNPIHTDVAVARLAGLEAPILHGTATLARAVSLATELAGVPLGRVRRVAGAFGAMVGLGTTLTVELWAADEHRLEVEVRTAAGGTAVRDGFVGLA